MDTKESIHQQVEQASLAVTRAIRKAYDRLNARPTFEVFEERVLKSLEPPF